MVRTSVQMNVMLKNNNHTSKRWQIAYSKKTVGQLP